MSSDKTLCRHSLKATTLPVTAAYLLTCCRQVDDDHDDLEDDHDDLDDDHDNLEDDHDDLEDDFNNYFDDAGDDFYRFNDV